MPPIENTELTTEWLEMILSPRCGKSKITSYELRKSTDYVGYISRVLALELQWQSDNAELPKHILFKVSIPCSSCLQFADSSTPGEQSYGSQSRY